VCFSFFPFQSSVVAILSSSFAYPECARSKVQHYPCRYKLDLYRKCCWVLQISAEFPAEGTPTFIPRAWLQLMISAQEKRSSLRSERVRGHVSSCHSLKNNQRDLTIGNASQRLAAGHGSVVQQIACMPQRLHICMHETRRAIQTSGAFTNKWRHLSSLQSSLLTLPTPPLPLSSHSTTAPSQPHLDFIAMRLGRVSQSWEDSVPVTCSMVVTNNAHSQLCHQT
jgi:hypothetical protein